jgi:hypothetical protein
MKTKEEIEELVLEKFKHKMYNPFFNVAFVEGYMQCQEDMADKKYTEDDIKKAIELARETESVRKGALSEDWDDIEKYDEMDIIYLLNKQD